MPISWSATGDMLSGIGTIGGAIAVFVAAWWGRDALATIKAEKQTERQIEHAEKILATAYRLKAALDQIRNPFSSSVELDFSKKELEDNGTLAKLSKQDADRYVQANVFYVRSRRFDADFSDAYDVLPYAKAYFGKEAAEGIETLFINRNKVKAYADAYARDRGVDPDFDKMINAALWKGSTVEGDDDVISSTTDGAIDKLEEILLPVVRLPTKGQSKFIGNKNV